MQANKPIYYHLTNIGNIYCCACAQDQDTQRYVNDDGTAYICDGCGVELYDDVRVDIVSGYEVWADKEGYRAQPEGGDWSNCSPVFSSYDAVEKWINERMKE